MPEEEEEAYTRFRAEVDAPSRPKGRGDEIEGVASNDRPIGMLNTHIRFNANGEAPPPLTDISGPEEE